MANAKVAILDTIGVMLAGSQEEAPRRLLRVPASRTPAQPRAGPRLAGQRAQCGARERRLGARARLRRREIALGGHPSAPVVPALLALADVVEVAVTELITAFVAGFETETRIARAVNFHHYEKGWQRPRRLGVFGAAAAAHG